MYFVKTPLIIRAAFRRVKFTFPGSEYSYITFDDGPDILSTEPLLKILKRNKLKATFFLTGKKAMKYPSLVQRIKDEGHVIGSHGFQHLSGWKTNDLIYLDDVEKSTKFLQTRLFRPAYGQMKFSQYKFISKKYNTILWDIMPGDFDPGVDKIKCHKRLKKHLKKGSVIVFHDAPDCLEKIKYCLDLISRDPGHRFAAIPYENAKIPLEETIH